MVEASATSSTKAYIFFNKGVGVSPSSEAHPLNLVCEQLFVVYNTQEMQILE